MKIEIAVRTITVYRLYDIDKKQVFSSYTQCSKCEEKLVGLVTLNDGKGGWHKINYLGHKEVELLCRKFGYRYGSVVFRKDFPKISMPKFKEPVVNLKCSAEATNIFSCKITYLK